MSTFKKPVSVLVVIHTPELAILLLERAAHPGYWQSVTGSQEDNEALLTTAQREVCEETGLDYPLQAFHDWQQHQDYEIFPEWRHRYAPGVHTNTEHVFSLAIAEPCPIRMAPREHRAFLWLPWQDAADRCFSATNRDAIYQLAKNYK